MKNKRAIISILIFILLGFLLKDQYFDININATIYVVSYSMLFIAIGMIFLFLFIVKFNFQGIQSLNKIKRSLRINNRESVWHR